MEKRWKLQFLGALSGVALMGGVMQTAHARIIDLDAGPDNWVTVAGRTVQPVTGSLIPEPAMQACEAGNCNLNSAFFFNNFVLELGKNVGGAFNIIGDDLIIVSTNGAFRFAAALGDNQASDSSPIPLQFGINQYDLELRAGTLISEGMLTDAFRGGTNQFRIDMYDGNFVDSLPTGVTCSVPNTIDIPGTTRDWCVFNRVNEYVHVTGDIVVVPEPGTLALLGISLTGLAAARRRKQ